MSDERDRRRPRTPPAGIRAQIAPPTGQSWDAEAETTPAPRTVPEAIDMVRRRHKITHEETLGVVSSLRSELTDRVEAVGERVDRVDQRVDTLAGHIGRLDVTTAEVGGKVDVLVDVIKQYGEVHSTIRIASVQASIEVDKTDRITKIEEAKARSDHRRTVMVKVLAAIGSVWAVISASLLAKGC